jgi:hypothetical protein
MGERTQKKCLWQDLHLASVPTVIYGTEAFCFYLQFSRFRIGYQNHTKRFWQLSEGVMAMIEVIYICMAGLEVLFSSVTLTHFLFSGSGLCWSLSLTFFSIF